MTREEVIHILEKIKFCCNAYEVDKALSMAIKALEREPILDKIRAEINSPNRGTCDYFIVDRIEEIINKYKAESEDSE